MTRPLRFWKLQSIGNDFPLIRLEDVDEKRLPEIAARLADRRFGVGGDGLLAIRPGKKAIELRMFNPDGTEDFCGNGIRIAARFAHDHLAARDRFTILHGGREIPCSVADDGQIETEIGRATYDPEKVPVKGGPIFNANVWSGMVGGYPLSLFGSVLSTGSTHTVIPTTAVPDDESFRDVSALIEVDPRFPQRTSVIWSVETAPNQLKIRIWERGVGETLGCGTGSSAAAVDYLRRKGLGATVRVENPGGTVEVRMDAWDAPIHLRGTAEELFSGEVDLPAILVKKRAKGVRPS